MERERRRSLEAAASEMERERKRSLEAAVSGRERERRRNLEAAALAERGDGEQMSERGGRGRGREEAKALARRERERAAGLVKDGMSERKIHEDAAGERRGPRGITRSHEAPGRGSDGADRPQARSDGRRFWGDVSRAGAPPFFQDLTLVMWLLVPAFQVDSHPI